MKNRFAKLLLIMLSAVVVSIMTVGLVACNKVTLESISIENARTEFKVGDEFEFGDGFRVFANYSDGSRKDVTESVEIRQEDGFDMNVPGDYMITVSYGRKREVYTITVSNFENILRKIELDTSAVKKTYSLGDEVSYDGLIINCTFENAQGNLVSATYTSLANFAVTVDGAAPVTDGIFMALGEYTVTVSRSGINDKYKVSVDTIDISTVQGAIFAGNAFKSNIISGTLSIGGAMAIYPMAEQFHYEYEFGNNYTYIDQSLPLADKAKYHMSMDESGLFCAKFIDGNMIFEDNVQASMMDGAAYDLWFHRGRPQGVEAALIELYKNALSCTNNDLIQTANEANRTYSFSFSGLKLFGSRPDYYETTVTFTLAQDYSVASMSYTQDYWEDRSSLSEQEGYVPIFITDETTGKTVPNDDYTYRVEGTATQVTGERVKTNPYSRDMFMFRSFDLMYDGRNLGDNGEIEFSVSGGQITVTIENINPTSASFAQDAMYFDCEGYYGGEQDSATLLNVADCFTAYRRNNDIKITPKGGGVFKLKIRTDSGIRKTITLRIIGSAPTEMIGQVGNTVTGDFYASNVKTVSAGGEIYFYGRVENSADTRQTYTVTSDNREFATVQSVRFGDRDCFKFTASQKGEYTVEVASLSAPDVKCVFTFTVGDVPDYENILKGSYTVTDQEGNIYLVEFTPRNANGEFDGEVKITRTPTDNDDNPLTGQAETETFEYYVNQDELTINLTHSQGVNLGVKLFINEFERLVLNDRYDRDYTLDPVLG